jgi:hypothetical protein
MFKISETNIALKYPPEEESKELKTDELWKCLEKNFTQTLPFIEQTIDRWNSQTQVIGNLKKNKQSHFSQTIVSQVNSLLAQSDFRTRTVAKTQLKRDQKTSMLTGTLICSTIKTFISCCLVTSYKSTRTMRRMLAAKMMKKKNTTWATLIWV